MSGRIHLKDRYGNDLHFGNGGDVWCPPFPLFDDYRKQLHNIRNLQLRDDDVILTGFSKSGTHWHREIIHMLLLGAPEYDRSQGEGEFLDLFPAEKLLPPNEPRIFFTHYRFHHLPKQVWEKKLKVLFLYRNPKDTWVSLYNHVRNYKKMPGFQGPWDQFFALMMDMGYWYGDWFDFVLDWEKQMAINPELPIMPSSFEDLKKDPVGRIMKIDQFLGLNRGKELCEKIAEACKFTNLKAAKDSLVPSEMRDAAWNKGFAGYYSDIGDWKNWFTVAQSERFDEVFEKRMSESKLNFTFE